MREELTMTHKAKIEKALVVLSPDLIRPDKPLKSALLERAVALAKITGCKIELFHVCYDSGMDFQLLSQGNNLKEWHREVTDRDATKVAEIVARLREECVDVSSEVRWDHPRTDAILRKIAQTNADVVMKQARERSFVLGITSNTDWDLVRRSPAHVWLVSNTRDDINRLVAAVGNRVGDNVDVTTGSDHEIMRTARNIADTFKAEVYPVNAYKISANDALSMSMIGTAAPVLVYAQDLAKERTQLIKRHERAVQALSQRFLIKPDNVHVREGNPSDVIPAVAEEVDADMIVIGANNMSRLERLVSAVTVEPVMAETNADILVVREDNEESIPRTSSSPYYGKPQYDLEQAITNPSDVFDSPQDVVDMNGVSVALRERILQAWEYDIRAEMVAENEGVAPQEINIDVLDDIRSAIDVLATMKNASHGETDKLTRRAL
jgi:universal stress protein E